MQIADLAEGYLIKTANPILTAAGYVLLAMAVIGFSDNFVVVIARHGGLWQFHAMRAAMGLGVVLALAAVWRMSLTPLNMRAVALRSMLVAASMFCYFGALGFLPVSQVAAGLFTSPIFVVLISVMLFGVRIGLWRISAVILGFGGSLIMLAPWQSGFELTVLLPVLGGALYAMGAVTTHHLCANERTMTLQAGFFIALLIGSGSVALIVTFIAPGDGFLSRPWGPVNATFLWLTVLQAVTALTGVGLITLAYQTAESSYVAVFEYSLLIFAGLFSYLIWQDPIEPREVLGMVLIVVAGAILALRSGDVTV